jgi:hypothetical protein
VLCLIMPLTAQAAELSPTTKRGTATPAATVTADACETVGCSV